MGSFVNGDWVTDKDWHAASGKFERKPVTFRNWVTPDGAPGPSGTGGFAAESGRYHLFVSYACPWAHRTLIFRALKGLTQHIDVDVVHPEMGEDSWHFGTDFPGATGDRLGGASHLREYYLTADPGITARCTVPVLWDKATNTIVSNESSEIIRMFNSAFDGLTGNSRDFWPEALRAEIETVNERVYHTLNNGVYRSGFAGTQSAYEEAVGELFATLDWLEARLSTQPFLVGDTVTEADWRLFVTLVRFDQVYHTHFRCNRRAIADYPELWDFTRALYQVPGVAETVNMDHIKVHYYRSHVSINPKQLVPIGPELDFLAPTKRSV